MFRSAFALGLVLASAGVALADIPPPPPPKGYKYISVDNELVVAKEVSGFVFVQQVTNYRPAPQHTFTKIEVKDGKPVAVPEGGRRVYVQLYAVPADVAKGYAKDEELFEALEKKKAKGAHALAFTGTATVSDSIKGEKVKWTTTVTAIGEKGIEKKIEGEGYGQEPKGKRPQAQAAPVVAGVLAALALALGGAWLVGRNRRKA
jgi:hypothetical protein